MTLEVPYGYEVSQALIARDILVDFHEGAGIRIAPHFYNSDEETENVIEAIIEILQEKSYELFSAKRLVVT